jgi:hypothetical protein
MAEHDGNACMVCTRPLSLRDRAAYGSRCEDCWCAGGMAEDDPRLAGGPYPLPVRETRGRPAHENPPAPEKVRKRRGCARSSADCYVSLPTSDDLRSITNQNVKPLPR